MLGVIENDTLLPKHNEWDCNFSSTGCVVFDSSKSTHEKNLNQGKHATLAQSQQSTGIDFLDEHILLFIFTFLPSDAIGILPRVCSRWNQLINTHNEAIYQHLVQRLLHKMYLDQHKREQEERSDDVIRIQPPPVRTEQQFGIVGASSFKHLYQHLTRHPSAASELLSKLLFVLSMVEGAQARRLPATRSISKNSPSPRKGLHSPISASPLISTKASSYLSSLLLEGVDIEYLPKELFNLTFLRELDVSNNKLTIIPKEFANLKNLQILYLANNQISTIEKSANGPVIRDCISCLIKLEKLDFSGNRLANFPEDWQYLNNLKELNVSNNTGHSGAKQLPLSWVNLSKLQVLWCSNNRIEVLPEEYSQLQCLQKLVADNNHIRIVPKSFTLLAQLRAISLRNNPIEQSLAFLKEALPMLQIQYDPTFAKHSSLGSSASVSEKPQNVGDGSSSNNRGKESQRKCIIQ